MFYPFAMGGRYMIRFWLRQYAVTCYCQIFPASQLTKSIHPQLSCPKLMLSYFLPSKRIIELAQSRWAEKQTRKLCFYISCFVLLWRSLLRRISRLRHNAQKAKRKLLNNIGILISVIVIIWHSVICHCHWHWFMIHGKTTLENDHWLKQNKRDFVKGISRSFL